MSRKSIIDEGAPCVIVHFDKSGQVTKTERYNLENYRPPEWAVKAFARAILPDVIKFYSDPKNQAEFEKWEADRIARGKEPPPHSKMKGRRRK